MKLTIGVRLIVGSFAIIGICTSTLLWTAVDMSSDALGNRIGSELQNLAGSQAERIDDYFGERMRELNILSQADTFEGEDYLAMNTYCQEVAEASGEYRTISVVSPDGMIVASSSKEALGTHLGSTPGPLEEMLPRVLQGRQGDVFFVDAIWNERAGRVDVFLMTPITDESNTIVIKVLLADVDLARVRDMVYEVDDRTIGSKAAYLVNDPGEVLITRDERATPLRQLPDIKAKPELREVLEGDEEGVIQYVDTAGIDVMAGYADLSEYGLNRGGDWSLLTIAPVDEMLAPVHSQRNTMMTVGLVIALLTMALTFFASRSITRPVDRATSGVQRLVSELKDATGEQARETSEQVRAVSETVASAEEVSQTAEQATERAAALSEDAKIAHQVGTDGMRALDASLDMLEQAKERVDRISESIESLAEQTQAIGEIIASVNDIAEQTHLLALNASIEAARAGEHGRGFSVVATEIKALADQSKKSTTQVRRILVEIQTATNANVAISQAGTRAMNEAIATTEQAGTTIRALSDTVARSATASEQIVASARQQLTGMRQIAEATKNIDASVKSSSVSSQQIAQAADQLLALAEELGQLVGRMRTS